MASDRPWRRADPAEYRALELRAHEFLDGVPLHDVWSVDLPGSDTGTTVLEIRSLADADAVRDANPIVRALFAVRGAFGRVFGWDDAKTPRGFAGSWMDRVTPEMRDASLVPPGEMDGPFTTLYADDGEAISEAINATVHAFLVFALSAPTPERRLYWAVYVRSGGALTRAYMALIDPFRRHLVYPAILRQIHRRWVYRRAPPGR